MSQKLQEPACAVVWGATGFIGRHIVEAMVRHGWRVRGLGRVRSDVPADGQESYESWPLDFAASDSAVAKALEGVTCAIHCAGHYDADDVELDRYVRSVRRMAVAAQGLGLDCLVLISSIAVYGTYPSDYVSLATPPRPETPYALSRWRAEQVAREILSASSTHLVVVRVPAVVGVDMHSDALRRFFRALRPGLFFHPGRSAAVFPCVGVHRLAECIVCLANSQFRGPPSVVQPVDCIPWVELADRYGRAIGRRLPRVGLPAKAFRFACRTLGLDVARALMALDSVVQYQDNCSFMVSQSSLPRSMDDIDALIGSMH